MQRELDLALPSVPQALAFLVAVFAAPTMWIVVIRFWRELRKDSKSGVGRVIVVCVTWWAGFLTVYGLVFLSNDLVPQRFTVAETQVMTRGYALSSLLLAWYLLWMWRKSK